MSFSILFLAARIAPGAFSDTPKDQKRCLEAFWKPGGSFWIDSRRLKKIIFHAFFMSFSILFLAAGIAPGAFPGTPKDQKRC